MNEYKTDIEYLKKSVKKMLKEDELDYEEYHVIRVYINQDYIDLYMDADDGTPMEAHFHKFENKKEKAYVISDESFLEVLHVLVSKIIF